MHRLLLCVFSYNRGLYLQNLLNSCRRFMPDFPILIIDDGSDDPSTLASLLQARASGINVQVNGGNRAGPHGGLYANMNVALNYAREASFDYVYFIQDDMQFVRSDNAMLEGLDRIMAAAPSLLQVVFNFMPKLIKWRITRKYEPIAHQGYWQRIGAGVVDTGVISVRRAVEFKLDFSGCGEKADGQLYWRNGARVFLSSQPHACWVPFPEVYRFKKRNSHGHARNVSSGLLVNFLGEKALWRLHDNDGVAFLEDFTTYHARTLLFPYWYKSTSPRWPMVSKYLRFYLGSIKGMIGSSRFWTRVG